MELKSPYAFVYDTASGAFLFNQGEVNQTIYPASITKLYSAWVALQYMTPETVVTAGDEVKWIDPESSRAWIYKGQKATVETLVAGMLLPSGNDAAYILAVAAGRAILEDPELDAQDALDAFVAEMNRIGPTVGVVDSHFVNPDGIHHEDHYTTMADLAVISRLALEDSIIRKYVSQKSTTGQLVSGQTYNWTNSNRLLHGDSEYYMQDACGLKTGHTDAAGHCLLSAFPIDTGYMIIGALGGTAQTDRYEDTLTLYDMFR